MRFLNPKTQYKNSRISKVTLSVKPPQVLGQGMVHTMTEVMEAVVCDYSITSVPRTQRDPASYNSALGVGLWWSSLKAALSSLGIVLI